MWTASESSCNKRSEQVSKLESFDTFELRTVLVYDYLAAPSLYPAFFLSSAFPFANVSLKICPLFMMSCQTRLGDTRSAVMATIHVEEEVITWSQLSPNRSAGNSFLAKERWKKVLFPSRSSQLSDPGVTHIPMMEEQNPSIGSIILTNFRLIFQPVCVVRNIIAYFRRKPKGSHLMSPLGWSNKFRKQASSFPVAHQESCSQFNSR